MSEGDLCEWVEHSDLADYRRDVLRRQHRAKRLEYDEDTRAVTISPTGVAYVEERIIGTPR